MLKRLTWQIGVIISISLRDDRYTLAQMRDSRLLQFFDLTHEQDHWEGVNLNETRELFSVYAAVNLMKSIVTRIVKDGILPNLRPVERFMLSRHLREDGADYSLVELDEKYQMPKRIIKGNLKMPDDCGAILKYESMGMWGPHEAISTRLNRYFDTGVNLDDEKAEYIEGYAEACASAALKT